MSLSLVSAIVILVCGAETVGFCEGDATNQAGELRVAETQVEATLVIAVSRDRVGPCEPIMLTATLTNKTQRPITFTETVPERDIVFDVRDERNNVITLTRYGERMLHGWGGDYMRISQTLNPGEAFREGLMINRMFDMTEVGTYWIRCTREIDAEAGGEAKKIVSNKVSVQVLGISPREGEAKNYPNSLGGTDKLSVQEQAGRFISRLAQCREVEDISALEGVLRDLEGICAAAKSDEAAWPVSRHVMAGLWLQAAMAIKIEIPEDYDPDDPPSINIVAPGRYPSGIAPEAIKEPELRRQYEAALSENKAKIQRYNLYQDTADMQKRIRARFERFVETAYADSPDQRAKLKGLMDSILPEDAPDKPALEEG